MPIGSLHSCCEAADQLIVSPSPLELRLGDLPLLRVRQLPLQDPILLVLQEILPSPYPILTTQASRIALYWGAPRGLGSTGDGIVHGGTSIVRIKLIPWNRKLFRVPEL